MTSTYVYNHELTGVILDWLDLKHPNQFTLVDPKHHNPDHDRIEDIQSGYELMHITEVYVHLFKHDLNETRYGMGMLSSDKLYAADPQFFDKIENNIVQCLYYRKG